MFKFFKKRKIGLENRLKFISENKSMNFSLDMIRNNQVDFQMIRQLSLANLGVKDFNDPYDIAYLLTFNSEKDNNELNKKRFLSSELFCGSIKIDILGETYIVFSQNDYDSLLYKVYQIGNEVYEHDYSNSSEIIFNIIPPAPASL